MKPCAQKKKKSHASGVLQRAASVHRHAVQRHRWKNARHKNPMHAFPSVDASSGRALGEASHEGLFLGSNRTLSSAYLSKLVKASPFSSCLWRLGFRRLERTTGTCRLFPTIRVSRRPTTWLDGGWPSVELTRDSTRYVLVRCTTPRRSRVHEKLDFFEQRSLTTYRRAPSYTPDAARASSRLPLRSAALGDGSAGLGRARAADTNGPSVAYNRVGGRAF